MNLTLVPVTPQTLPAFSRLLRGAARWLEERGEPLWSPADLTPARLLEVYGPSALFLATLGCEPIGTAVLLEQHPLFWPDARVDEALYLHKRSIVRAHAGKGLGRALLEAARAEALARGKRFLRLDTASDRPALVRFYEGYGFARAAESGRAAPWCTCSSSRWRERRGAARSICSDSIRMPCPTKKRLSPCMGSRSAAKHGVGGG